MEAFAPSIIAFYLIAAVVLALAVLAVTSVNLIRAALALAFCFFAVAGFFWLLGSPFLAVLQLVINAGAIPIVTIFIVMMTQSRVSYLRSPWVAVSALLVAVPLALVALVLFPQPTAGVAVVTPLSVEELGAELLSQRGDEVTLSSGEDLTVQGGTLLAFEMTALVLLVAFVGTIILAKRDDLTLRSKHEAAQIEEPVHADP